jgi:hypothetical protein
VIARDWAAFLPFLAGLTALAVIASEPDDGTGPVLHDDLALFTAMPWI